MLEEVEAGTKPYLTVYETDPPMLQAPAPPAVRKCHFIQSTTEQEEKQLKKNSETSLDADGGEGQPILERQGRPSVSADIEEGKQASSRGSRATIINLKKRAKIRQAGIKTSSTS